MIYLDIFGGMINLDGYDKYQMSHFEVCPDPGQEGCKTSAASKPFVVPLQKEIQTKINTNTIEML